METEISRRPIVLTNCTARKRGGAPSTRFRSALASADVLGTVERWKKELEGADRFHEAKRLYVGRAFTEALRAAESIGADCWIVSAGLGLVHESDEIPAYDATIANGSALSDALNVLGVSRSAWWESLVGDAGVASVICSTSAPVLLACPATYVELISADLERTRPLDLSRLRIFTSEHGRSLLPANVRDCALPYDSRLEALGGYGGTQNDFPQRALRHFVEEIEGIDLPLSDAKRSVQQSLSAHPHRQHRPNVRLSDDEIRQVMARYWQECKGQSSRLLRALRDDAQVACEQGRFARLWRKVRSEIR